MVGEARLHLIVSLSIWSCIVQTLPVVIQNPRAAELILSFLARGHAIAAAGLLCAAKSFIVADLLHQAWEESTQRRQADSELRTKSTTARLEGTGAGENMSEAGRQSLEQSLPQRKGDGQKGLGTEPPDSKRSDQIPRKRKAGKDGIISGGHAGSVSESGDDAPSIQDEDVFLVEKIMDRRVDKNGVIE